MLAIRMQRTGRKGHPEFRVVVQDSRLTPSSGRVVARLGHYNPHTKAVVLDKQKTEYYLTNGAQPSERVVRILLNEKVALPEWVSKPANAKERSIKNPDKLRRNQPAVETEAVAPVEATEPADDSSDEVVPAEPAAEEATEVAEAEKSDTATVEESPAEESATSSEKSEDTPKA